MPFFYNQPTAHRFGIALQDLLGDPKWTAFSAAVAWVRRSGVNHIDAALTKFLRRGGAAKFIVGVDIENTSEEGLRDLLSLQSAGNLQVYINHNEGPLTYHPKVYLFEGASTAHLIVGSNNLTESGMFSNTEAGLEIEVPSTDTVAAQVRAAMASWSDLKSPLVRLLDTAFLGELTREGYVLSEATLRSRRKASRVSENRAAGKKPLFGSIKYSAPPATGSIAPSAPPARKRSAKAAPILAAGPPMPGPPTALLMRVRRASATARRTQIQISIALANTPFFAGVSSLTSTGDGRVHAIVRASARGTLNTLKIDIPEIEPFADPVLRVEKTPTGLVYEAYDSTSPQGQQIMGKLQQGLQNNSTTLTLPSDPSRSTWYRFI